jgi:putative FmdB family regulatory protein
MPTYDYICTACQHVFEKFHSVSFDGKVECPVCGNPAKRKIGTGMGLIFKGSGFYITDYKNSSSGSSDNKNSSGTASGSNKKDS